MQAESPNMKPSIRDFSEGSPDRDLLPTALGEAHLGSFKAWSGVTPASGFWPVKCLLQTSLRKWRRELPLEKNRAHPLQKTLAEDVSIRGEASLNRPWEKKSVNMSRSICSVPSSLSSAFAGDLSRWKLNLQVRRAVLSSWLLLKPPFGESLVQVFFCSCKCWVKNGGCYNTWWILNANPSSSAPFIHSFKSTYEMPPVNLFLYIVMKAYCLLKTSWWRENWIGVHITQNSNNKK